MFLYKEKHLIGAHLQFRGLVHFYHGRKHGDTQGDMVLEKEMSVLHLDPHAAGRKRRWDWLGHLKLQTTTVVFLSQLKFIK